MSNHPSTKHVTGGKASPRASKTGSAAAPIRAKGGSRKSKARAAVTGKAVKYDVQELEAADRKVVDSMLIEGVTFDDIVEGLEKQKGLRVPLAAVQKYFQAHPEIQAKRARHLVKSADVLLRSLGKDPRSAEARLARAAFLTGFMKLRREALVVSPKDAEHSRLSRENVALKRQVLVMQKQKAQMALRFSEERTRMLVLTQEKLRQDLSRLQEEARSRQAGEPMGPEILQRIQQLYGLASQPLLCEGSANGAEKA